MHLHTNNSGREGGSILVFTIVFSAIFVALFASLMSYLITQYRWSEVRTAQEQALHIAEAGIEYYRWRLSHFPTDIQDGTGGPGPYPHDYHDPEVGAIGRFELEIGGEVLCDEVQVVQATSTGWTFADPSIKRTIVVRIARPTVADYTYVVDSNVYAGSSRTIMGPYHGNGVVRMEGTNMSAVTSAVTTANCAAAGLGGCPSTNVNGVYHNNLNASTTPSFFSWGQPQIPFSNFDYNFGEMESKAISDGIFLPKVSDDISLFGYYLEIDGTNVDIYEVDSVWDTPISRTPGDERIAFPELAGNMNTYRTFLRTEPIPQDCPLIYVEDRTWLEGQIDGKVTVVANDTSGLAPDLFLQDNLTYNTGGGVDGITVLAEGNLLIPLYVPDDMTISGIFFAQKGAYGRNWYEYSYWTCNTCTNLPGYTSYKRQHSLTTNGTIVSKLRTGTAWGTAQGFDYRYDFYDRHLAKSPPPMTPFTSPDFRFIEWREVE
jgi:hypothetical protein